MSDFIISLQEFTLGLPEVLRWLGIMVIGMIPYLEAEGAAIFGVIAGLNPAIAIPAGIAGNAIALAVVVWVTSAVRGGVKSVAARSAAADVPVPAGAGGYGAPVEQAAPVESNPKRARMRRVFDKYGVPGVSILGPLLLPSHITAAAMVGFGAPRLKVFVWGVIAVSLWAILFGLLFYFGVTTWLT